MPIYEYSASATGTGCPHCQHGFDVMQSLAERPLAACPKCGGQVVKVVSVPSVGASKSGLDHKAKAAGFHKLQRVGKGEYEKKY